MITGYVFVQEADDKGNWRPMIKSHGEITTPGYMLCTDAERQIYLEHPFQIYKERR